MALYPRIDRHNLSKSCLSISVLLFVSACLIGAWITLPSSIGPASMGITLDLFMGGMPKKVSEKNAFAPELALKAITTQDNQLNDGNPSTLENVAEDLVFGDPEKNVSAEERNGVEDNNVSGDQVNKEIGSIEGQLDRKSSELEPKKEKVLEKSSSSVYLRDYRWKVCNTTSGPDYMPCLDNIKAIKHLHGISHYEHMERHCPDEPPTCLVPLPEGYRTPIRWPKSKDMIWFKNVPHTRLAEYKRDQNWVRVKGRYTTFPGGGTQFKNGALHYIDFIQKALPDIAWGKRSRVILDVGCGVASFGGYLFERDVLTMSLAPKDVHEAQVQFALERGIPAILAVMGSKRLPFPSMVFDIVHCARCRVPWHAEGGRLLLELNRVLRPGGYFVWSATPVYRRGAEDVSIWKDMSTLTKSMCWDLVKVAKDELNKVSAAIYQKPTSNDCYKRRHGNDPPLCEESDDPNSAWYTMLKPCIHKVPSDSSERGSQWPVRWPLRLEKSPYWLKGTQSKEFYDDYNHWKYVIASSYVNGIGIDWTVVRNVMDMKTSFGGFAASLKDLPLWVMNVVPVNSSDRLPIIYERGLLGLYHDWCESFNTYPRSYDLLHASHLFSDLKKRCNFVTVMAEVDRILRPGGKLIVRDDTVTISEVESAAKSLHWRIKFKESNDSETLLCVEKTFWRPSEVETVMAAIA